MRQPHRKPGFTLIEIIISAAIFLMMLTAIYQVLLLSIRHYHKVRDAAEIQGETLRVLSQLQRALVDAAVSSVQVNPSVLDPVKDRYITFVSAETDGTFYDENPTDGALRWQRFVCIYVDQQSNGQLWLTRKDRAFAATTTLPTSLPTRDNMANDSSLRTLVLTRNLTEVAFGDNSSISLKLSMLSENNNGLTVYTRITPRQ